MVRFDSHPYVLYIIFCYDADRMRTYIGITNNLPNRLRKHNGEITGGAKYTKRYSKAGCVWTLGATAHCFVNKTEALQAEWAVQNPTVSKTLKTRTVRAGNPLSRAVSDLFYYCAHAKHRSHLRAVLHTAPQHVQRDLTAEGHSNYCLYPATLLFARQYNQFIEKIRAFERIDAPQPPLPSPTPHHAVIDVDTPAPPPRQPSTHRRPAHAHPPKPAKPQRRSDAQSRADDLRQLADLFERQSQQLLRQAAETSRIPHGRVVIRID